MIRLALSSSIATVLTFVVLTGCGSTSTTSSGTSDGGKAFPAGMSLMLPQLPSEECGNAVLADGGLAATAVIVSQVDLATAACGDAGTPPGLVGTQFLELQLATAQYADMHGQGATLTQSLAPGTYAIADEGEDDEDLCMTNGGQPAILQLLELGDASAGAGVISTAMYGTIQVTSVDAHSIAGTFSAAMGDSYGHPPDSGAPMMLTGSFQASTCP